MQSEFRRSLLVADTGQSFVYRGVHTATGDPVAIKELDTSTSSRNFERDFARFKRELRVQMELSDLAVMPILHLDMDSDPPHYVMPWADTSLRDYIINRTDIALDETLEVFSEIVSAVVEIHERGVIHRDLKPENLLFLGERWVLADFGMCRQLDSKSATITSRAIGLGTIEYAAPEQIYDAHAADARSDVYSLGKILYHLLSGEVPFPSVRLDHVPIRFRYVVARATKDDPNERYPTAMELSSDLELLLRPSGIGLQSPIDVAKQAHDDVLAGSAEALETLNETLLRNPDDEVLYTSLVPYLSEPVVAAYVATYPDDLKQVVLTFDHYVSGGLRWEFTDVVAVFLEKVFLHVDEPEVRELALRRILLMGYSHNRWAVRDVFCRLARASAGGPETLMLVNLLRANPEAAAFVAESLRRQSLPQVVIQALPA